MNKTGLLEDLLEKGKSGFGDTGQAIKSQLTGFGKTTVGQVSPGLLKKKQQVPGEEAEDALGQKPKEANQNIPQQGHESEEDKRIAEEHAEEMVKHLYGVEDTKKDDKDKKPQQKDIKPDQKKAPSEEEKIQELRRTLHQEYYQGLTTPPKPQEEEERPAEKVEQEKKMEDLEQQERDKKKPPPLAIQRSQQKAEKFPGASG